MSPPRQYLAVNHSPLCTLITCGLLSLGSVLPSPTFAASASEQTNIQVMIRQLNALEDSAKRSATVAHEPGQRYAFDYSRLAGDLERIRTGLESYLTPSRAQPRDAAQLSGQYSREDSSAP